MGKQTATAPDGSEFAVHVAPGAGLGPLLVQVSTPLTVEPADADTGKPDTTACMSATGTTDSGCVSTLLVGAGSAVTLPAVVVMLSEPTAGAAKVLEQVMLAPTASGLGTGLGRQVCVAPTGNPLNTQVGAAAGLGPALLQVPLTVTACPATGFAGTVVAATMSA